MADRTIQHRSEGQGVGVGQMAKRRSGGGVFGIQSPRVLVLTPYPNYKIPENLRTLFLFFSVNFFFLVVLFSPFNLKKKICPHLQLISSGKPCLIK